MVKKLVKIYKYLKEKFKETRRNLLQNLLLLTAKNKNIFNAIENIYIKYYKHKIASEDPHLTKTGELILHKKKIGDKIIHKLNPIFYADVSNKMLLFIYIYNKVIDLSNKKPSYINYIYTFKIYIGMYDKRIRDKVFPTMLLFELVENDKGLSRALEKFKLNLIKFLEQYDDFELHFVEVHFVEENAYQLFVRKHHREPTRKEYEEFAKALDLVKVNR